MIIMLLVAAVIQAVVTVVEAGGKPGIGDVFPANAPFQLVSLGASWSDQPFLRAALVRPTATGVYNDVPFVVSGKLGEPGFVICKVQALGAEGPTGKPARAGAGFDPSGMGGFDFGDIFSSFAISW